MSEEPKRRTLGDYGRPYKIESCIVLPPVDEGVSFELDPSFIMTSIQFSGLPSEDANTHLYDFLAFCDIFKCDGLCYDGIRLRLFPISLRDSAKSWLYSLPARSITTWDQLATKFLSRYSPPSKLAQLRRDILNFAQFESEPLYEAKKRFQDMLIKCPDLQLPDWHQAHIFFEGLTPANRSFLDISIGAFLREYKPKQAYDLLGELAFISHHFQQLDSQGMMKPEKLHGVLTTHSDTAALSKQVESLTNALQNLVTLMQKQQSNMNDLCGQLGYLNTNSQEGNSSSHETKEIEHEHHWY
ncbi:hypothetical protein L195_g041811 [Trifolium pratense]|uniref:Retrotransposon gag domain-containing protein n=3 Tax=Trifolium pratense TaxID=57577 RepID=A0A2K3M4L8_TRIPR|nr:hypothetical protein L195_g041811 [Trifolium pratense]CAJ2641704.1 unnamed protein product [Trifolium pratense]